MNLKQLDANPTLSGKKSVALKPINVGYFLSFVLECLSYQIGKAGQS
jgi:hypothetical protein